MSDGDGFLGRWSKRKLGARQGKVPDQPECALPPVPPHTGGAGTASAGAGLAREAEAAARDEPPPEAPVAPPPTLEDVEGLTPEADFTRFAAADVAPEVKNAALKKLFADPRYNVMDGMDVYTGDYSRPDPIPRAMLRQLASARLLGLVRDEEPGPEDPASHARDVANNPTPQKVAQSGSVSDAVNDPSQDADPDLQLQQDDAASGKDPGRGAG